MVVVKVKTGRSKEQNKHPSSRPAYHREVQIEAGREGMQRLTYPMLAWVRSMRNLPSFPGDGSRELFGHFFDKTKYTLATNCSNFCSLVFIQKI